MASRAPRQLLPKPPPGRPGGSPPPPASTPSKRKRVPVAVACERCRKRKSKCDGVKPACQACAAGGFECQYLGIAYRDIRDAFDLLRHGANPESLDVLNRLRENQSHESSPSKPTHSTNSPERALPPSLAKSLDGIDGSAENTIQELLYQGHVFEAASVGGDAPLRPVRLPVAQWTRVSDDDDMLTHLITLFWTWDSMLTRIIDRGMFLEDLCSGPDGMPALDDADRGHFCSALLVNAMLAASGFYCHDGEYPNVSLDQSRAFAEEGHRLLEVAEGCPLLPLMQGTALLWLYEANMDNGALTGPLLERLFQLHALSVLPRLEAPLDDKSEDKRADRAQQATIYCAWGFYSLDTTISLVLDGPMRIRKPMVNEPLPHDQRTSHDIDGLDDLWFPYPFSSVPRPSYRQEVLSLQCDLAQLSDNIITHADKNRPFPVPDYVGSKDLYSRLLRWEDDLVKTFNSGECFIPARNFLSITSHMLLVKVLEPFKGLSFLDFGNQNALSGIVLYSGSIASDLRHLKTGFGLRRDYWVVQACRAAAMAILPHLTPGSVQEGTFLSSCEMLQAAGPDLPLANSIRGAIIDRINCEGSVVPEGARRILTARVVQEGRFRVEDVAVAGAAAVVAGRFDVAFCGKITSIGEVVPIDVE